MKTTETRTGQQPQPQPPVVTSWQTPDYTVIETAMEVTAYFVTGR